MERKAATNDLEKATFLKEEANELVKLGKHQEACELYFEAINTLRWSDKYKSTAEAKATD